MKPEEVHELLRSRKSVYPPQYIDLPIDKGILTEILESANWAPTHKLTEPWRFKVIRGEARTRLGEFLAEKFKFLFSGDKFSEVKYNKQKTNPLKADTVIAICMQRDPKESLPEWEELSAVAMAVQNLWLAASAYGIGGYWSSPPMINFIEEHLDMDRGEKCVGLFYLGYYEEFPSNRKRNPIEQKITWIE